MKHILQEECKKKKDYKHHEDDLRKKTLNTLEWELTEQLNKEYNLGISVYDLSFKQDVIYE